MDLQAKLKKLLTLARQGIGGERTNAQRALEKLMAKHNITLDDLDHETQKLTWLTPAKGKHEKSLLYQTISAVVTSDRTIYKSRYYPGKIGIELTPAEEIEIQLRYGLYLHSLKTQFDITYKAFVQINHIFHSDAPPASESETDPEEIKRMALAMMGMTRVPIHLALPTP